jgi:hypothetical protein
MKFLKFFAILLFPLTVFADGVSMSQYSLDAVKIAFLVKVLLFDAKKGVVKVEILRKFSKDPKKQGEPAVDTDSVDAAAITTGQAVILPLKRPAEMVAHKWVEDTKYWNSVPSVPNGSKAFIVAHEGQFELSSYSSENENKFETLFDPKKTEKQITEASPDQLKKLVQNQDFESVSMQELIKRKILLGSFIGSIQDRGTQDRLTSQYLKVLPASEHGQFWIQCAEAVAKMKSENHERFLQRFLYDEGGLSLDTQISVYEKFNPADLGVQSNIRAFFDQLKEKSGPKLKEALPKIQNLYLGFLKYSYNQPSNISLNNFFSTLNGKEKTEFLHKVSNIYLSYSKDNGRFGPFEEIINELDRLQDLHTARMLTALPLEKLDDKEKIFNVILSVLFAKEDCTDLKKKEQMIIFAEKYGSEARYTIQLQPKNKIQLQKLGIVFYQDLDQIRLVHQKNSAELAGNFTRYYEKAITVEVVELNKKGDQTTVKLKIEKNLGAFSTPEPGLTQYSVRSISRKAKPGETLLLAIDSESFETLKNLEFKKMVLLTRAEDYKFLILEIQYAQQIEEQLKNQK